MGLYCDDCGKKYKVVWGKPIKYFSNVYESPNCKCNPENEGSEDIQLDFT